MNKKNNNKGFTLAELLIVVAIIAVLVAIAIPVFTSQLEKSREATDAANIRSAYADLTVKAIDDSQTAHTTTVPLKQTNTDWQNAELKKNMEDLFNVDGVTDAGTALATVGQKKSAKLTWVKPTADTDGHVKIEIVTTSGG